MSSVRPVLFHPHARDEIRALPKEVRFRLGRALMALQLGHSLGMPLSRPMPSIAAGVAELRLRDVDGQHRIFYWVGQSRHILVLRAFHKKSQQTPQVEFVIARRRLKELMNERP
jgi:phage-related protein